MSDTVKHDFDAAETLSRQFDAHFTTMKDHHARTTRARTRAVSGRHGTDGMGQIVSDMADKALGAIETALDSLADHAKNVSGGLRKMSENHRELEKKLADDYKKIVSGHDTTPVYLLDHNGDLHRLHADGSKTKVDSTDNSGINDVVSGGKYPRFRVTKPDVPPLDGDRVQSQKVRPSSSELSRATQRARLAQRDYGTLKNPDEIARTNYAALHYQDGDRNFILVARSDRLMNAHSERRIGVPIIESLQTENVRSLYTERAPCDSKQSNCGGWLHQKFPHLTDVSHSFDYSSNHEEHSKYLRTLKDRQFQIHRRK